MLLTIDGAVVVPPDSSRMRQRAGVFDSGGKYLPEAEVWRNGRSMTLPPLSCPDQCEQLQGRWLWAGSLYDHFGHFLIESFSRLWAVCGAGQLDGILYIPKRIHRGSDLKQFRFTVEIDRSVFGDRVKLVIRI